MLSEPTLRWPASADEPRLVKIETGIVIARPANAVFAFVTNASLWHYWHPATEAVSGVQNRPLVAAETVTESIRGRGAALAGDMGCAGVRGFRVLERQSERALINLKRVLESKPG